MATLGFVVLAVGAQAPIAFIIAFIPMLFIAAAYQELNREIPDCGTTFTWASKAFGPRVGWMGGWGVAVAGIVVLANLAQIGGIYFWLMLGQDELAESTFVVTATGVVFIALMCWVSYRGLEIGERLQSRPARVAVPGPGRCSWSFVIYRIATGQAPAAEHFSWQWFNPFAFADYSGFIEAVLLALFIYWGWDTCLALNEETKDPQRIPGRAAIISTADPAGHLRRRHGRGDGVRGVGEDGLGARQRGERRRRLPRPQGRRDGPDGHRAGDRGAGVGGLLDPDHRSCRPPAARLSMATYKPCRTVPDRAPAVQHPVLLHPDDGRGGQRLLRRHDLDQRQHPAGLDPLARPGDRLLLRHHRLRLRLVLPQGADVLAPQPLPEGRSCRCSAR